MASAKPVPPAADLWLKPLDVDEPGPAAAEAPRPSTEYRVPIDEEDQARRIQEAIDAFQREAADTLDGLDEPNRP